MQTTQEVLSAAAPQSGNSQEARTCHVCSESIAICGDCGYAVSRHPIAAEGKFPACVAAVDVSEDGTELLESEGYGQTSCVGEACQSCADRMREQDERDRWGDD